MTGWMRDPRDRRSRGGGFGPAFGGGRRPGAPRRGGVAELVLERRGLVAVVIVVVVFIFIVFIFFFLLQLALNMQRVQWSTPAVSVHLCR